MKKIYKVLMFGMMVAVLAAGSAVTSFAQGGVQQEKEALYAKYINNYDKDIEKRKIAVEAGKEYLQKFGEGDASADQLISYFKENIPVIEQGIKDEEKAKSDRDKANALAKEEAARAERFNTAVTSKNYAQVFTSGKEVLANKPNFLDVYIVLATIGYDRALAKDNTFNNEAIDNAKKAIQLIKNGEKSTDYGVDFGPGAFYAYKTSEFPDTKENALGWLNYNIGYIMYYNQNKPKEALPYLYEATKHNSVPQKASDTYRMIGKFYLDKVAELEKERQAIRTSLNNQDNEKTLELFAMQKGYADRGMDFYARAYNVESASAAPNAETKQGYYNIFKKLYTFRNNGKDEGADAYLESVKAKTLPNPETAVQPIVAEADKEVETVDETTPATTTTETTKPAATTTTTTKPADKMDKTAPKPTKP